jgi:hypothetical protein
MNKNNPDPVGTLSIGNVVTTGTILYKSNFKRYFQVSVRATGWLLAIVGASIGAIAIGSILFGLTKSWLTTIPVGLGSIGLILYLSAKYATDRAVICRLAYQELIDAPETVSVATQQLIPRTWGFLRLSCLVSLYLSFVAIVSLVGLSIGLFLIVAAAIYGLKAAPTDPFISVSIFLLVVVLLFVWILIIIRFCAYWFIAELPLAIESTKSATFSLRRNRQLNTNAVRRIGLIITIAFLITLPINIIDSVPSFVGQTMSNPILSPDRSAQSIGGALVFAGFLLSLVSELLVMPFWQTIKAIVYYDLRNRREGSDLTI